MFKSIRKQDKNIHSTVLEQDQKSNRCNNMQQWINGH